MNGDLEKEEIRLRINSSEFYAYFYYMCMISSIPPRPQFHQSSNPDCDQGWRTWAGLRRLVVICLFWSLWVPVRAADREAASEPARGELLGLVDLPGYRAALSGEATADPTRSDDSPVEVRFQDLWRRPGDFRGRQVTVRGRVERSFHQGPVGRFPSLSE